jgi:hypothetical protein
MANADLVTGKIRALLAAQKGVSEKMFGGTAFMLGGKMCVGTLKDDLLVRVEPERNDEALAKWLEMSIEYVSTLKKQKRSKPKNNRASR